MREYKPILTFDEGEIKHEFSKAKRRGEVHLDIIAIKLTLVKWQDIHNHFDVLINRVYPEESVYYPTSSNCALCHIYNVCYICPIVLCGTSNCGKVSCCHPVFGSCPMVDHSLERDKNQSGCGRGSYYDKFSNAICDEDRKVMRTSQLGIIRNLKASLEYLESWL